MEEDEELQLDDLGPARPPAQRAPTPTPAPAPASPNGRALDDANAEVFGGMTREQIHHAAVLEQMAHGATYNNDNPATGEHDHIDRREMLKAEGYNTEPRLIQGENGMQMVVYEPAEGSDVAPVVSFRGTEVDRGAAEFGADLVGADTDPEQVGARQYEANQDVIDAEMARMAEQYGPVEVTGHSLGGTIAQITAAQNPEAAGHITTFQAPGMSDEEIDRINAENERRTAAGEPLLTADHFTVEGCLVDPAGEGRAPGDVHDIQLDRGGGESPILDAIDEHLVPGGLSTRTNPVTAHTSHPLTALAEQTGSAGSLQGIIDQYHEQEAENGDVRLHHVHDIENMTTDEEAEDRPEINEIVRHRVGLVERTAEHVFTTGMETSEMAMDIGQTAVRTGSGLASSGLDQGQRTVNALVGAENAVIDGAQNVVTGGSRLINGGIDNVESVLESGADLVGVGDSARQVNRVVDRGQRTVTDAISGGSRAIDGAQHTATEMVASGQNTINRAQQRTNSAIDRGMNTVDDTQARLRNAWEYLTA